MIRETKNALSDTLKRQDEESIPSMYTKMLHFGEKCVDVLVDESDYTWFEISSICFAFNVEPNIFESESIHFYLSDDKKSFVNEMDIFTTPLVDKPEFTDWYSNYAVPRIISFIVNRTDYNEDKYGRVLNLELERKQENFECHE
ncbi:hypothetical protein AVEN_227444-1 [Araneus ventricosus]|uniref:Uncharacterized protein n=1 Tax=Araneus ventricosus TaxID=182803 RepID=A0A4Y2U8T3_ARAVE|nr:hypothetical protein AVEN_227444-1 [Araneus ventricosus]